jgi:hypothetical protein
VGVLSLADGRGQIARITGNGMNLYYDPAQPGNAYLNEESYALANGGMIIPIPEPASGGLAAALGAVLLCRRRKRCTPATRER